MRRINTQQSSQPIVRKLISTTVVQQSNQSQVNAINKVNNLMQRGSVSVLSNNQPKIIRQRTVAIPHSSSGSYQTQTINSNVATINSIQHNSHKCFVCDEMTSPQFTRNLSEAKTTSSQTELPNKIASVVGESFMVVVGVDDVICRRCYGLFNQMDRMESEVDRIRSSIKSFINKKYNISDDEPPVKMQKLNSGMASYSTNRSSIQNNSDEVSSPATASTVTRKIVITPQQQNLSSDTSLNTSTSPGSVVRRQPVKLYKCVSCDFKTTNLNAFQPHYDECKGSANNKIAAQQSTAASNTTSGGVANNAKCLKCNKTYLNATLLNKHIQEMHSEVKQMKEEAPTVLQSTQNTTYSCQQCVYKTQDKQNFDQHQAKHIKNKPFKCRLCLMRFETREEATIHAKAHGPSYFKCTICDLAFNKKALLDEHSKLHENKNESKAPIKIVKKIAAPVQQQVQVVQQQSTQKLLQESIDEALRGDDVNSGIQFHTCHPCNLTFLNDKLYQTHMKSHETTTTSVFSLAKKKKVIAKSEKPEPKVQVQQQQQTTPQQENTFTERELESIFEKMHAEPQGASNGTTTDGNVLITTQEGSGGITYNITIPQDPPPQVGSAEESKVHAIDMPTLDQQEEDHHVEEHPQQPPVSMPSLDEDDHSQTSQEQEQTTTFTVTNEDGTVTTQTIPVNLQELQNAADGQPIKLIFDNGQYLQLENDHYISEGNQILLQAPHDPEQLQQLLQSVGMVVQGNGEGMVADGEHTTLQMIDENNQMILVQSQDGQETRLIDASMLSGEGGNIVIQQGPDGETHFTTADGIPIGVTFADHNQEGTVTGSEDGKTVTLTGEGDEEQQFVLSQAVQLEGGEQNTDESEATAQVAVAEQDQQIGEESQESQEATEETPAEVLPTPSEDVSSTSAEVAVPSTTTADSETIKTDEQETLNADPESTEESSAADKQIIKTVEKTDQSSEFDLGEIMQTKEDEEVNKDEK